MMTRRSLLALTGAAAIAALGATTALAQEVTLRLHQFLPAQSAVPKNILDPWADRIEEQSEGRIRIQRFPSMQLGGTPPQLIDQAIDGVVDIIWTLPGYTPGRFPRTEVFELPFMMTNAEATSRAFWKLAEETMLDKDFRNVKVLGLWVHGPGVIHSRTPVRDLSDLDGLKLRAPSRVTNMLLSDLGATPIGMPVPAVPESLSKGVIDAAIVPWEVTSGLRVAELVDSHTEFDGEGLYTATFVLAMNQARYDSLPEDLKGVIDANSGEDFSAAAGKQQQADDAPARQIAEEMGNEIVELGPEQVEEWKSASQPTIDAWVQEMDEKGMDGAGLLQRARTLIEENTQ